MKWTLLIYVFAGSFQGGAAVQALPGFESERACMEAAARAAAPLPKGMGHIVAGCIPGPT